MGTPNSGRVNVDVTIRFLSFFFFSLKLPQLHNSCLGQRIKSPRFAFDAIDRGCTMMSTLPKYIKAQQAIRLYNGHEPFKQKSMPQTLRPSKKLKRCLIIRSARESCPLTACEFKQKSFFSYLSQFKNKNEFRRAVFGLKALNATFLFESLLL